MNAHGGPVAGYSGTPLAVKLGLRSGLEIVVVNPPEGYRDLLEPVPERVTFARRISGRTALVHIFATSRQTLAKSLRRFREQLAPTAVVWVSWPKRASNVSTDITENTVREVALPLGFVDVKVCAVTEVWSGLKLVVRKERR
jgi:hypothetical protein